MTARSATDSRPTAATDPQSPTQPSPAVRAKDRASMAVVLSGAAIAWFGWGHQGGLGLGWLRAGMLLSALTLAVAIVRVRRIPALPTLATDPRVRKVYWVAVSTEVALIVVGAIALGATGNGAYLSTWTLLVVGVHFLPLAEAFDTPVLRMTALGCAAVAAGALWSGLTGWLPAPNVAGAGGGILLLGVAIGLVAGGAPSTTRP